MKVADFGLSRVTTLLRTGLGHTSFAGSRSLQQSFNEVREWHARHSRLLAPLCRLAEPVRCWTSSMGVSCRCLCLHSTRPRAVRVLFCLPLYARLMVSRTGIGSIIYGFGQVRAVVMQAKAPQHNKRPSIVSELVTDLDQPSVDDLAREVYNYTGETGTYRYMAPEVFRHEPYNAKVLLLLLSLLTSP